MISSHCEAGIWDFGLRPLGWPNGSEALILAPCRNCNVSVGLGARVDERAGSYP